jgi:hypothetical protein
MVIVRRKNLKNRSGQALVEYMLVIALMVTSLAWGFNILKCRLYGLWVNMACDVFFPYPKDLDDSGILRRNVCNPKAVGECSVNAPL